MSSSYDTTVNKEMVKCGQTKESCAEKFFDKWPNPIFVVLMWNLFYYEGLKFNILVFYE